MKEQRKKDDRKLLRTAASEGIVLLKNENHMLPLTMEDTVSVFGRCQLEYYRSGTGSGGSVNVEYKTNLIDGLRRHEEIRINREVLEQYENWIKACPYDNGGGEWAGEPWHQEEPLLSEEIVRKARRTSSKAIVIIGRTAGEDQDNTAQKGSYYLTDTEQKNLELITEYFEHTAVLLNVANIIDMQWLEREYRHPIEAVLYVWQGGIEGGNALADILTGAAVPSGKLTDTIARRIGDYPASDNFGNELQNLYQEDIYVGYRYFETFCREKVLYPFGFGLSYTEFELSDLRIEYCGIEHSGIEHSGIEYGGSEYSGNEETEAEARISLNVKNSGKIYPGKETVQIYVQAPQGRLGRPEAELICFQKTRQLGPGESQKLEFVIALSKLAAYDDSGLSGYKSCYVLEQGDYKIFAGTNVRDLLPVKRKEKERMTYGDWQIGEDRLTVLKTIVCRRAGEALAPTVEYKRLRPGRKCGSGNYEAVCEAVPVRTVSLEQKILNNLPQELLRNDGKDIHMQDVLDGSESVQDFAAQLTEEELAALVRGEGMCSPRVTAGTASAFGGVADGLIRRGIAAVCTADGPSGIRMDNGAKAMQLPIGTMLAATWNTKLAEELYERLGAEMLENKVDVLLGPGANLHRHPLNGRNFEYYSEDPYVPGKFAAAAVRGLKRAGVSGTVKHFACNNQEAWRNQVDAVVSERALREIYLRGFEMAVKEGGAGAVMTAYNPLNGHWCASIYELCTELLRNEWGFEGIVMTDWWAKMNDPAFGGKADMKNTAAMIRAQNDLYMVVTNGGAENNSFEDNTLEALREGKLTKAELQRSAVNICRFILSTPAAKRKTEVPDQEKPDRILFKPVRFVPGDGLLCFEITTGGRYKFIIRLRSPLSELSQSSCNLVLNDTPAATIQSNGTGGEWRLLKLNDIYLEAGVYLMRLEDQKPGLEIAWIDLTK